MHSVLELPAKQKGNSFLTINPMHKDSGTKIINDKNPQIRPPVIASSVIAVFPIKE